MLDFIFKLLQLSLYGDKLSNSIIVPDACPLKVKLRDVFLSLCVNVCAFWMRKYDNLSVF